MNAIQRAERWAMDSMKSNLRGKEVADRYLELVVEVGVRRAAFASADRTVVEEGGSLEEAAAKGLRRLGITDFEEDHGE